MSQAGVRFRPGDGFRVSAPDAPATEADAARGGVRSSAGRGEAMHTCIHTYMQIQIHTYIHTRYIHTYIHSLIPPWEDQREWHRMTRMTRPDCAVMCNLINIHTCVHTYIHTYIPPREDQCEWHRMTRMTGPDCVVMCNLINTYIHIYICTYMHTHIHKCIQRSIHAHIHAYIDTCMHRYIHACIRTYIYTCSDTVNTNTNICTRIGIHLHIETSEYTASTTRTSTHVQTGPLYKSIISPCPLYTSTCVWEKREHINITGTSADREILIFPVQLTTNRIGNLTRSISLV